MADRETCPLGACTRVISTVTPFSVKEARINGKAGLRSGWEPQATTSKVKRIYLIKKTSDNKTLQLTWQSNQWCKITTIVNDAAGSKVEKEEKITWDY